MKTTVAALILLALVSLLPWNMQESSGPEPPQPGPVNYGDYSSIHKAAEQLYARKSFQRAYETYLRAPDLELAPDQTRWVEFRLADTLWRSKASTQSSDPTQLEEAERQLQELLRREPTDVVAAEINQSLGDYHWMRRNARNWNQAWPYYQKALGYWAGSGLLLWLLRQLSPSSRTSEHSQPGSHRCRKDPGPLPSGHDSCGPG